MNFYYGVVEDRNDPQKLGRVRVRVHGIHTENKQKIGTPDLPWATVLMPTTSATLSGFGTQHGLVEGTTVVVTFKDGRSMQEPMVIGGMVGFNQPKEIPVIGFGSGNARTLKLRDREVGFNDPRALKESDYVGTPDGPIFGTGRSFGLLGDLENAPITPETIEIDYSSKLALGGAAGILSSIRAVASSIVSSLTGGTGGDEKKGSGGTKITNPKLTSDNLPYYPLENYYNESDVSVFAQGEADYSFLNSPHTPDTKAAPKYPYNKSLYTESGHLIEYDDTRDAERILIYHRSGTYTEVQPLGDRHTRVVQSDYEVVCGDKEVTVCGDVKIVVKGNASIEVTGKTDITSGGNLTVSAPTISLN